jgi:hypothetical protein
VLKGSKGRKRSAKDKHNKFQLLKSAKFIIKNAAEFQITERNGTKYYVLSQINKKEIIKVLVKKDLSDKFYFYSVMRH